MKKMLIHLNILTEKEKKLDPKLDKESVIKKKHTRWF